jgi:hypothetical protein
VASTTGGDTTSTTVWRTYRCPYEQAFTVQYALEGFCDLGLRGRWEESSVSVVRKKRARKIVSKVGMGSFERIIRRRTIGDPFQR